MELNNKEVGDKFLSINNYEMLYSNDGVDTNDYASLEQDLIYYQMKVI